MNLVRTRFAPSPTGIMHIGNVRAALMNYLFAKKYHGTFALRIEDTDAQRNIADGTASIIKHLNWLGLTFQEGPEVGGNYGPYFQSQRAAIYQKYLEILQNKQAVYRCFCTPEELEVRRNRQIAMKKPPRYESNCLKLSADQINTYITEKKPFIWRMKLDSTKKIMLTDLARGTLEFDLQHFSDFPITREDGSFTFIFANCIDDCEMKISHVFRGEEHLSNTVNQIVLYQALDQKLPVFWHLPILFNQDGKKLSKRDKGFSLDDVKDQGFLPEAVCNYLGILGCSFEHEIMNLETLAQNYKFDNLHGISQIKYDLAKLKWINHKWIASYEISKLVTLCKPLLARAYDVSNVSDQNLATLIAAIANDMQTLTDCTDLLKFYFVAPTLNLEAHSEIASPEIILQIKHILQKHTDVSWQDCIEKTKQEARTLGIPDKVVFATVRILVTGSAKGMQLLDLYTILGPQEFFNRIKN